MRPQGFTLAELLIALAILGVIATFTIPKVLQSQQDEKHKAMAKEAAAMISGAFQAYKSEHSVTPNLKPSDLLPYLNYVKLHTGVLTYHSGPLSNGGPHTIETCGAEYSEICLKLHNGGLLILDDAEPFNKWCPGYCYPIFFGFAPDGGGDASSLEVVRFGLYHTGRISSAGPGEWNASWVQDPGWFSWD